MPKHKAEAYALQPVLVPQQHQYTVYASAVGSLSRFLCCHFLIFRLKSISTDLYNCFIKA